MRDCHGAFPQPVGYGAKVFQVGYTGTRRGIWVLRRALCVDVPQGLRSMLFKCSLFQRIQVCEIIASHYLIIVGFIAPHPR